MQKTLVDIRIEVSEAGIRRIQIAADDDQEQSMAHRLLDKCAPQIRALDAALRISGLEK